MGAAPPPPSAVLETLWPRKSTKVRDSIMRRQFKASSKKASKEKGPLGFIWPSLVLLLSLSHDSTRLSAQH